MELSPLFTAFSPGCGWEVLPLPQRSHGKLSLPLFKRAPKEGMDVTHPWLQLNPAPVIWPPWAFVSSSVNGRKAMTNLDSILKSTDNTLPTKVCIVRAMVFPVIMYRCENWTIKKAECQRMDAFKLWCWRRLLKVPWTARTSNQSIIKEFNPEYSLDGLMLKLKLQYFGHLMWRTDSLEKTPMLAGKDWRQEEKGMTEVGWHHWLSAQEFELWEMVKDREAWRAAFHGVGVRHVQLSDWTTVNADDHSTYLWTLWLLGWLQLPFVKYSEHCLGIVKVLYLLSR